MLSDEKFENDYYEKGHITTVEIEGVTSNIFKFAELVFSKTELRYAFQEIYKYEMMFDSEGKNLK